VTLAKLRVGDGTAIWRTSLTSSETILTRTMAGTVAARCLLGELHQGSESPFGVTGVIRSTGTQPSSTARRGVDRPGGGVLADASPQPRAQEVLVVIGWLGRVDEPFDDFHEAIRVVVKRYVPGVFEDL
jgi:hypothetical protein